MSKDPGPINWPTKKIFTTGQAATVCKVSQQTIIRCFDSGRLSGFRVPGSKFRRIPRDELIRFMKTNDIPLDAIESGTRRVLVVDDDPQAVQLFVDLLKHDQRLEVRTASTGYDAGLLTESFRPHLLVLDSMLPDLNGLAVCQRIRERPALRDTRILCVSGVAEPQDVQRLLKAAAHDFLKKPLSVDRLMSRSHALPVLEPRPPADHPPPPRAHHARAVER